jgi:hypothetical protein
MVEKGRKNREKPPCATDKKLQNATNKHLLFLLNKKKNNNAKRIKQRGLSFYLWRVRA